MLETPKQYRKKPTEVSVALVTGEPYTCTNPQATAVIASPGEYVVNPGSNDEYPITAERLAALYDSPKVGIENAKQKLSEAIYALKQAQVGVGRGAGGREIALAVTNAEQSELWLGATERAQTQERAASSAASSNSGPLPEYPPSAVPLRHG